MMGTNINFFDSCQALPRIHNYFWRISQQKWLNLPHSECLMSYNNRLNTYHILYLNEFRGLCGFSSLWNSIRWWITFLHFMYIYLKGGFFFSLKPCNICIQEFKGNSIWRFCSTFLVNFSDQLLMVHTSFTLES